MRQVTQAIWTALMPYSPVFSTSQVAEVTDMVPSNVSRDLAKLQEKGMVVRIRRGLWAIANHPDFSPYAVVPHLFEAPEEGYVSLLSALNLHGMIDQIPRVVQVMTTGQRPRLRTPVATYEFHQIQPELFAGHGPYRGTGNFEIALPEKALFDTLYLSARKGRRFSYLPEVETPANFSPAEVEGWIARVDHEPLRLSIADRWSRLAERAGISRAA